MEKWERSKVFWITEDEEWMKEANANEQLSKAIANTDNEESKAVIENFLRRKDLSAVTKSEESLGCLLAQLDTCDAELEKHIRTFNSSYQRILQVLTKLQDRIMIV